MKAIMFLLIVALTLPVNILAFTDLGRWAETYQIKEKIIWKEHNSTILTKDKIENMINKAEISKEQLPTCKKNTERIFDPTVTLKRDIVMPKYHINIKKGEKFNPLKYQQSNRYILLVDGSDSNQTALAEHYENVADIITYNASIKAIKPSINSHIYIATKAFTQTFKPRCVPTIYTQQKDVFIVKEIDMSSLVRKKQ